MEQYVYKDKLFIVGKISEVTAHLKELSATFTTVKELLDNYLGDRH